MSHTVKFKTIFVLTIFAALAGVFVGRKIVRAALPTLKEGTFLSGQTLSVWPSWSNLGNILGVALPTDPINQLGMAGTCAITTNQFCTSNSQCPAAPGTTTLENCILHDPETGWSTTDRRFSFACSAASYAYRYIVATSGKAYTVRARFEDPGININNWNNFTAGFISSTLFKISEPSGVCNQDQEISTLQSGVCGDGQLNLNKGEQCDPPGRVEYQLVCSGANRALTICNNSCQWVNSTTPCSGLSKCGNGAIEAGEICDDGSFLNGKYNRCSINCAGPVGNPPGRCGDAVLQSAYEICDPSTGPGYVAGTEKYSLTSRNDSCGWDCQNWGPYCGDKIVQAQYGEGCDGSQACIVAGSPGYKICTDDCKKVVGGAASAWWRMETLVGSNSPDSSGNLNNASCASSCPEKTDGKYGNAFLIQEKAFFTVNHSPSLVAATALTVSAWISPTGDDSPYQKIVEKGGSEESSGYDLEYNSSSTDRTAHIARFNVWGSSQVAVDTRTAIPTDEWTYLVGTYEKIGAQNIVRIYVNGVLENENIVNSVAPVMDQSSNNLFIGKGAAEGEGYFFGKIDEVKIYNRALSGDEISSAFQNDDWLCIASTTPASSVASGSCGNSVVETDEACDQGSANNGLPCVPAYGVSCSYCSANCQNTIDVQPTQYCGNGIIEATEKCEKAVGADTIYSVTANSVSTDQNKTDSANGYRQKLCSEENLGVNKVGKGTKTCDDCALTRNCVTCGLDPTGVQVSGKVLNVLQTTFSGQPDPLMVEGSWSRSLKLYFNNQALDNCWQNTIIAGTPTMFDNCSFGSAGYRPILAAAYKDPLTSAGSLDDYTLQTTATPPVNAKLNSNLLCSTDDPDDLADSYYTMVINSDYTHRFQFPVLSDPSPGQYDIVASPIITNARSQDVRVVVSWESTDEFFGGFVRPGEAVPTLEGADYTTLSGMLYLSFHATGKNYYSSLAEYKKTGIWYHGFISSGKRVESFTVDAAAMSSGAYSFYVRAPGGNIESLKNIAKLKVEVFASETDLTGMRLFGAPIKTYYLKDALNSENHEAGYWHVFNLSQPSSGATASATNIVDINQIITNASDIAVGSCTSRPAGSVCRPLGLVPVGETSCDIAEVCTGTSDFCPADAFRSAGTLCRASVPASLGCDLAESCTGLLASCPVDSYAAVGASCGASYTCSAIGTCNVCAPGETMCPGLVCRNLEGTSCSDGNPCTTGDTYHDDCGTASSCYGTVNTCNDGRTWTTDSCNPVSGACVNTLNSCNDGNLCTVGEAYNISGACVGGTWTPANCCRTVADCTAEDGNPCLMDASCNTTTNRCRYDLAPEPC